MIIENEEKNYKVAGVGVVVMYTIFSFMACREQQNKNNYKQDCINNMSAIIFKFTQTKVEDYFMSDPHKCVHVLL